MNDRTGRPEQIRAPALRSIIKTIDLAIENGSLDPNDRDEVIKMFISGPTTVVDNKRGGGMMNMDEMTMPLQSYEHGGMHITPKPKPELSFEQIKEMMLEEDKGSKDLSKLTLMEKIRSELEPVEGQTMNMIKQKIKPIRDKVNDFIKFGRGDKERFFGGATGTDFYLDDPSLIEFIKKRAGTNDENSKEYQNELIKFMDEVTPKKNMGGMMNMNDIIKPLRDN
tara:strand:- start:43 stop:714 length:672 start_codon:yes stop_codon:yes gene_type:complete